MKLRACILFVLASALILASIAVNAADRVEQFQYDRLKEVEISSSFFTVEIKGGEGTRTSLRVEMPDFVAKRVTIERAVSAARLRVIVRKDPSWLSFNLSGLEPKLILTIPRELGLRVQSSSGGIKISDLQPAFFKVSASSGGILLSGIRADLEAETSSGSLTLRDCQGTRLIATTSGSLEVTGGDGRIEAATSSGSQYFRGIRGDVRARATSGRIHLESITGMLKLSASSGSLSGSGITLTGNSRFETSSGSITFRFANRLSALRFNLTATSGSLRVGNQVAQKFLLTGDGFIRVDGRSSSGSQSYDGI